MIKIRITNCLDCKSSFRKHTPSGEECCFCGCADEEDQAKVKKYGEPHKLVAADSVDVRMWSTIPDFCPLR